MTTEINKSGKSKILFITLICSLLILPIINFFLIDYLEYYYFGDVTKEHLSGILYYISESLAFVLKYVAMATVIFAVFNLTSRQRALTVLLSYLSLLIPYASVFFIAYFGTSNFASLLEYFIVSASVNFGVDIIICTLVLLFSAIIKVKSKRDMAKSFYIALLVCACILLLSELSVLVYETVDFALELKYEYYDSITTNELINVIVNYISVIIKAILGYCVMRIYSCFLLKIIKI